MLSTVLHTKAIVADYLWAVLTVIGAIALGSSVVRFFDVVASLGSSELSIWGRIASVGFALGSVAALVWVTAGAWRRTVWGCGLANTEQGCLRHGSRCAASRGGST